MLTKSRKRLIDHTDFWQKKALLLSRAKGLVMNPQIRYQLTSINHTLLSILNLLNTLLLKGTTWINDKYTPI